jgi:serine/threonine-protein kinase
VQATPRATRAPTGGKGVLNINSIPVSRVILDGVPKGTTPVMGVKVSPGTHTVVFMHPTHGRKVRAVSVQPGKTATAAVRFP